MVIAKSLALTRLIQMLCSGWIHGLFIRLVTKAEILPLRMRSTGVDNIVTFDVEISADSSYIYLAMPDSGCFRSDDYGLSWQNCNDPNYTGSWGANGGNTMTVATDPDRAAVVWMTQANHINNATHTLLRSSDYGATWTSANAGLPTASIPSGLSVDPHSPIDNRRLFMTSGGDVYKSVDDGDNWVKIFDCNECRHTAIDPFDSANVYAGGEAGFWRSTDGGDTWLEVGLTEMRGHLSNVFWGNYWNGVSAITPDPNTPGLVYVTVYGKNRGVYRSEAWGESGSWLRIYLNDYMWAVTILPHNGTILAGSTSANYSGGL